MTEADYREQIGYHVNQGEFWAAYFAPSDPSHQVVYALEWPAVSPC